LLVASTDLTATVIPPDVYEAETPSTSISAVVPVFLMSSIPYVTESASVTV